MDINIKVDFEERFLSALEKLVGIYNSTPAQAKIENAEKPRTEPAQIPAQAKKEEAKEAVEESSTVPTEANAYTFEQIQVACANLARSGKREELGNLIKEFGIPSLPDLKEEDYNNFALKLREIGGTI